MNPPAPPVDNFKKQLWISFAVIVGSAVIAGVALFLLAGHIDALTSQITAARQATADESAAYGMIANLKTGAASAAQYQVAMDKLLPSQDGVIAFSAQVSQLAAHDGVTSNFSFQGDATPAQAGAPGQTGFTLSATGPLENIQAFLKDLETTAPVALSRISTFDLSRNGGSYTVAAQGNVYFK
jgi:hypothetical protein